MIGFLRNIDRDLLLWLNGFHNSFFDMMMPYFTAIWWGIPLFAWWIWLLYKKYGKKIFLILLFVAALIGVADLGSNQIKHSVKRYRPSHNTEIGNKLHIVDDYRGGQYGFVSSHAANVFAVAVFLFLLLRPVKKVVTASLFVWAVFIVYTRIYLGVHYPLDILGGAILGSLLGFIFARAFKKFCV